VFLNIKRLFWPSLVWIFLFQPVTFAQTEESIVLQDTISLPNVEGRLDHMSLDSKTNRLFLAALGNNSLEVIDLNLKKHIQSIKGFNEPQGVLFIPEFKKVYVTNGGNNEISILNSETLHIQNRISVEEDGDNIRYDSADKRVYVGSGEALFIIDASTDEVIEKVELDGHPESFQVEEKGSRVFVNVPSTHKVIVIDKYKQKITEEWPIKESCSNFPMALDEQGQRLFIGCRNPAKLIVFDIHSALKVIALDMADDSDDLFYYSASQNLYASCGKGIINVFHRGKDDVYESLGEKFSANGARTALLDSDSELYFLAVPHRGNQKAEIQIYRLK
jgi:YVTN family beta-propeller protein